MRSRKLFALLVAAAVPLAAVSAAGAAPPTKVGVAYDALGLGDLGFNDAVQAGANQSEADYGVKLFESELVKPSDEQRDPAKVLTKLTNRSDLVVAVGFTYLEAAAQVAATNPSTNFAVIDGVAADPTSPNLLSTTMAANEGSFLVGAAAGNESTTGKIGFIGGVDYPVIHEFEAGFAAGVEHANPTATVEVEYIEQFPNFGGFNNPARARQIAEGMYESGIDVIYHAAGGSGFGLFEAARNYSLGTDSQVWAIGVDYDQYLQVGDDLKPYILTSMIKRFDVVTYDVIESQALGTFSGGREHWDLSRNGVDYATSGGFVDTYVPTLEQIRQDIINGVIDVPTAP